MCDSDNCCEVPIKIDCDEDAEKAYQKGNADQGNYRESGEPKCEDWKYDCQTGEAIKLFFKINIKKNKLL